MCVCVCVCVLFFEGQTRTTGAARWGDDDALSKGRKNNCLLPWEKTFFWNFKWKNYDEMGDKKPTKLKLIFSCVTFSKKKMLHFCLLCTLKVRFHLQTIAFCLFLSLSVYLSIHLYLIYHLLYILLFSDELNGSERQPLSNSSVINLFTYIPKKWLIKVLLSIITMYSVFLRNC